MVLNDCKFVRSHAQAISLYNNGLGMEKLPIASSNIVVSVQIAQLSSWKQVKR